MSKIIYYDKNKKKIFFLEDFREISLVGSLKRGRIVGLREVGWTYQRIAALIGHDVLVLRRFFQQWSVEHPHIH